MELTTLKHFRAIARAGHMTRAADTAGVSQPALSAMLKKLEAELGAELFHRTPRGVELTEAGRVFLEHAEDALRAAEQAAASVRELAGLERGEIRMGGGATATAYLLPPIVRAFRSSHPGVRFFVREAGSRAVADSVRSGELDMGIVTLPLPHRVDTDLLIVPLTTDELRLIVPEGHPLSGARTFDWHDLRDEPVIAFEAGSTVRAMIDAAAFNAGVELNVAMELRSVDAIVHNVRAGIGVGFVSRFALEDDEGARCADAPLRRELALVRRSDRVPSPAAHAFEELLVESLRGR
ncbi:MAG: LysR substrate-binding domain-containing protein [Phycisphaerales bacterium]